MDKEQQELKKFLQQQLEWSKHRSKILAEINDKLHEMKGIAEYSLTHSLSSTEIKMLNSQLKELQNEILLLEDELKIDFH